MIEFVLGQSQKTDKYEASSYQIRASSVERRHVTFSSNSMAELTAKAGRDAWTYLHTTDDSPEIALAKFEAMIPSYGCGCKSHYAKLKADYPPDFTDGDSFFRWGWFVHNSVNEKLGKPIVSLEEARIIWNRPQPTE